jgi:hypothetical protein
MQGGVIQFLLLLKLTLSRPQRQHWEEHRRAWLKGACEMTLQVGAVEPVLGTLSGEGGG